MNKRELGDTFRLIIVSKDVDNYGLPLTVFMNNYYLDHFDAVYEYCARNGDETIKTIVTEHEKNPNVRSLLLVTDPSVIPLRDLESLFFKFYVLARSCYNTAVIILTPASKMVPFYVRMETQVTLRRGKYVEIRRIE